MSSSSLKQLVEKLAQEYDEPLTVGTIRDCFENASLGNLLDLPTRFASEHIKDRVYILSYEVGPDKLRRPLTFFPSPD